jgi:hypothetical protein
MAPEPGARSALFVLYTLAAAVAASAFFAAEYRYEPALSRTRSTIGTLYARSAANDAAIARASYYFSLKREAERDLAHVEHDRDSAAATAAFIAAIQFAAKRHGCKVLALTPGAAIHPDGRFPDLSGDAMTFRVRGTFAQIVHFLEDVPRHRALVEIAATQISAGQHAAPGSYPQLDADITAALYRLSPSILEENNDASAH